MNTILDSINQFFVGVGPITSFLWSFPTRIDWYKVIPVLGQFPLAILMLFGAGIFFTLKTGFVQIRYFKKGLSILTDRRTTEIGVSPFAAFMLSTAMRVGAGNIVGVTGAITIGGPGAVFWMWCSAFLGMATSFAESTLSQIYKERNGNEYVGGLTHYGQKLLGDNRFIGVAIGVIFIFYRMFSMPIHTFHVFVAAGSVIDTITGTVSDRQSFLYYVLAAAIIVSLIVIVFGGIRRVTTFTDKIVPVMAVAYSAVVIVIVAANITRFPSFISMVFVGAFKPAAIFGGVFGVALSQGIRRGLLSNEAGMGTVTMAAAVSENNHPCEQGMIQSIGVFLDTMIICSMTAFVVTMGQIWTSDIIVWETFSNDKLAVLLASVDALMPGTSFNGLAKVFVALSYGIFAFTTLLGGIVFCEISASRISNNKTFITILRCLSTMVFVPFGCATVLAGLHLDNLWTISDMINIVVIAINIPIILIGGKTVIAALRDYESTGGKRFVSERIGIETSVWKEEKSK